MAFIAFRTNPKKDKDIDHDLGRFTNMTKRVKELYRLGLAVERGEYVKASQLGAALPVQPSKPLSWNLPKEPTVKPMIKAPAQPLSDNEIENNMLGGF